MDVVQQSAEKKQDKANEDDEHRLEHQQSKHEREVVEGNEYEQAKERSLLVQEE